MDLETKCGIIAKLDYEGGYDYLIGGYSWPGIDPDFDRLVKNFKKATKALEEFLNVEECEGEDGD